MSLNYLLQHTEWNNGVCKIRLHVTTTCIFLTKGGRIYQYHIFDKSERHIQGRMRNEILFIESFNNDLYLNGIRYIKN